MARFLAGLWLALTGCAGSDLDYSPAELAAGTAPLVQLQFRTAKGRQVAFYLPPRTVGPGTPRTLVVVYPGIGSRALDFLEFANSCPVDDAAFLLLDYPGRGLCEGRMRPRDLPDTTNGALGALATHLGAETNLLTADLRLFGHSFGTGAALQAATRYAPRAVVLAAPFDTLTRALFRRIGPLAWLVPDELDNREALRRVLARPQPPGITILHGSDDASLPVTMGRSLAALAPERVRYLEVPGGSHVDILENQRDAIFAGLFPSLGRLGPEPGGVRPSSVEPSPTEVQE